MAGRRSSTWSAPGNTAEAPGLDDLKSRVGDGLEDARDRFTHTVVKPHEHHNTEDREALNKLIARRTTEPRS